MNIFLLIIVSILTALLSLVGGFLLLGKSKLADLLIRLGRPFAAIVLVFCICFDLIPEALESKTLSTLAVVALMLGGFLVCLAINFLAGHLHKHGEAKTLRSKSEAYSMLVIDSLHTLVDGIVLGVAFAANLGTGLLTAVSTVAHEVPQEIGDFGIMLRSRFPKSKILKLQIASSLLLVPSAVVAYYVGGLILPTLPPILAVIAGFFLYIAFEEVSGMIKESRKKGGSLNVRSKNH